MKQSDQINNLNLLFLGHMVDWSIKMYQDFGDAIPKMFGDLDSVPIIRDRKGVLKNFTDHDGTGLR